MEKMNKYRRRNVVANVKITYVFLFHTEKHKQITLFSFIQSEIPIQRKRSTSIKETTSNKRKTSKSTISNGQIHPTTDVKLIQATTPPLSNYEQKQILDGLLHHSKDKELTFDEAQTFAIEKAVEISTKVHYLHN